MIQGEDFAYKMQNLGKGMLSGEGFFVQQVSGRGTLFVESFGAIHELDIPAGETGVIDNHHLVAWDAAANYTLEKAASGWDFLPHLGRGAGVQIHGTDQGLYPDPQSQRLRRLAAGDDQDQISVFPA